MNRMDIVSLAVSGAALSLVIFLVMSRKEMSLPQRNPRQAAFGILLTILLTIGAAINFAAWRRWFMPDLNFTPGTAAGVITDARVMNRMASQSHQYDEHVAGYEYELEVHYRFAVKDHQWIGHAVPPNARELQTEAAAQALAVKEFPKGAPVTIYYDPSDPYENALAPFDRPRDQLDLAVVHGILMIVVALTAVGTGHGVLENLRARPAPTVPW